MIDCAIRDSVKLNQSSLLSAKYKRKNRILSVFSDMSVLCARNRPINYKSKTEIKPNIMNEQFIIQNISRTSQEINMQALLINGELFYS